MVLNNFIRLKVRKRAKYLCEYYHSSELSNATFFTITKNLLNLIL